MPLPMPPMMSGSRFAPKIRTTMKRMTTSSGRPMRPILVLLDASLYHQLHGAPGEFPLACSQQAAPQPAVGLDARHELNEDLADLAALAQRRHKQLRELRRKEQPAQPGRPIQFGIELAAKPFLI